MTEEELTMEVVILNGKGLSQRGIATKLEIGRKKVRNLLNQYDREQVQGNDVFEGYRKSTRNSKLDTWGVFISQNLEKYPDLTAVRMHEKMVNEGFDGGITILRDRLRQIRPKPVKEPVIRFETEPGEQGQMDWSPYKISFRHTGKQEVLCFSYVLGFSRRQYIDFSLRRDFYTLIQKHQDAFAYFGGVPNHCLYDGEKTIILRWEAERPVYNPRFIAFLTHYGSRPVGCRPGRPQTKGKVERPFQYVEGNLLNGREFDDLQDLRQTARWWMQNRSDTHKHATTGRPPIELFQEKEQAALLNLPLRPYDTAEIKHVVGRDEGFIVFDGNQYSIPFEYMYRVLIVKATKDTIVVYDPDIKQIAEHPRHLTGAGKISELEVHREAIRHQHGLEPVRKKFLSLGPDATDFLIGLKEKHPRRTGYYARRILALLETYMDIDINKAMKHANRYHAYDLASIENILSAKAKPRELEHWKNWEPFTNPMPEIGQRSLGEYPHLG